MTTFPIATEETTMTLSDLYAAKARGGTFRGEIELDGKVVKSFSFETGYVNIVFKDQSEKRNATAQVSYANEVTLKPVVK